MKILILSWRDIKHPYGGGAEDLTHQMAKRWVKWGNEVTYFSATFPGAQKKETIDGIAYIREGNWYNVHLKVFLRILFKDLSKFDVVVDEVHGIPFFVNFYSTIPVVCLACEVAKDIWDRMYPFPLNIIGRILENLYLIMYRSIPFLTISESTKKELVKEGIPEKNITIVPMGFSYTLPAQLPKKEKNPRIIFLGRLVKTKGIEDAINAFSEIERKFPNARMWIVGKGTSDYEARLRKMVGELALKAKIEFKGFVSESEKYDLLARSHVILVPSSHEGWGLIVPEANIVGTVAIVYNVPGLRDVVKPGKNGIIVDSSSELLAGATIDLLSDSEKYNKLSKSSMEYAKSMDWDNTAKVGLSVLEKAIKKK